jgi:tetratricopeptide (TPR) repeat protein
MDTNIDTLEAKGLIQLAAFQPELEYLFRHWLVQDAAYGSLLKQERRQLHRLVGQTLESLYPERRRELAGILAMHFEQAGDDAKAIDYLIMDGRYALERAALIEAFAAFDRAARLLPAAAPGEADDARRARVEVGILRARAGLTFRSNDQLVADLEGILPAAEQLADLELVAQVHLYLALARIEDGQPSSDPAVSHSLERLKEIGATLQDPSLAALPLAMVAMGKVFTGPIREGVDALERAIPLMEKRRDFIGAAFSRGWLAIGYATLGEFEKADAAARAAAAEAASGDLIAQLDAQIAESMVRSTRGELDEAAPLALACVERAEEAGATACAVVSSWVLGDVYQRQHRLADARGALRLGLDLAPGSAAGMWGPTLQAWLRANEEIAGDPEPTGSDWDEALAVAREMRSRLSEAGILWKRAEAAAARGRWQMAAADFEASVAIYREEGARPYLARVLRGWGDVLRLDGHASDGDEKLQHAQALFEEMGLTREAEEVRHALAEGGTAVPHKRT